MTHSLIVGLKKIKRDTIISYTDIIFNSVIINKILRNRKKNILIPVLKNWKKVWKIRKKKPYHYGETIFLKKNRFI